MQKADKVKVTDGSNDNKYFTITPRLVWALSRDPYDYTFWGVIKDIAGDKGECYLNVEQLAALSMMSVGKIVDCRKHWIDKGLLEGEIRRDASHQDAVWHLRIPDFWDRNIRWAENYASIDSRIDFKRNGGTEGLAENVCSRCLGAFDSVSRRSRRCPPCQEAANKERRDVMRKIGPYSEALKDKVCAFCEGTAVLEYHIEVDAPPVILCRNCHDELHREGAQKSTSSHEVPENVANFGSGTSPDEVPPLSDEVPPSPDEVHPLSDEVKKNHKEEPKEEPKKSGLNPKNLWEQVSLNLQKSGKLIDCEYYLAAITPLKIASDILVVYVFDKTIKEWALLNMPVILQSLRIVSGKDMRMVINQID